MSKKELSNLRNQINKLDEKLFSMIFKRMNIAKKIGEIKVQHNMEITNSDRENELIKHILGLPDNSLDQDEIESIYKLFFSISKKDKIITNNFAKINLPMVIFNMFKYTIMKNKFYFWFWYFPERGSL